ncbi:MAG: hypothetical protein RLZZ469_1662 [Bacteroidota bacterium]|jgi:hypothetical protein
MKKHWCKGGATSYRECIECRARLILSINDKRVRLQMIEKSGFDVEQLKEVVTRKFNEQRG